jgi:hypothetical protein
MLDSYFEANALRWHLINRPEKSYNEHDLIEYETTIFSGQYEQFQEIW